MAATKEPASIISKSTIQPSSSTTSSQKQEPHKIIHLTPWDLRLLSIEYMHFGLLLPKPLDTSAAILRLKSSLSLALDHFFPLAGRLATIHYRDATQPSLSIVIECNNQGAEFIHAALPDTITSAAILRLSPLDNPDVVVRSLFPLHGAASYDGHSLPLLAVQATELVDGIFVGCALNHAVADGTSFWHFINSWAEISRNGNSDISSPPILDRWFPDSLAPPIFLPFKNSDDFIKRHTCEQHPSINQRHIHFSMESIAMLKAKANTEVRTKDRISSLQALLAHVWISVTRARKVEPHQRTCLVLFIGHRPRLRPPLPATYFGNSMDGAFPEAVAGELIEGGLGCAARILNQTIASDTDTAIRRALETWTMHPIFPYPGQSAGSFDLMLSNSPRFDVYGNDFGWGRPAAVRSGGDKFDGDVLVYEGAVKGSMELEICLAPDAMRALLADKEFLGVVIN